jgi:hypothetical protein
MNAPEVGSEVGPEDSSPGASEEESTGRASRGRNPLISPSMRTLRSGRPSLGPSAMVSSRRSVSLMWNQHTNPGQPMKSTHAVVSSTLRGRQSEELGELSRELLG